MNAVRYEYVAMATSRTPKIIMRLRRCHLFGTGSFVTTFSFYNENPICNMNCCVIICGVLLTCLPSAVRITWGWLGGSFVANYN